MLQPQTGAPAPDAARVREQLERITASDSFAGKEALVSLLRFLVEFSIRHPNAHVREAALARDFFGKGEDFDPRLDSAVRVQVGRLRQIMAKYCASKSAAADPIIIEIPHGSYHVEFYSRVGGPGPAPQPVRRTHPWRWTAVGLLALAALAAALFAYRTKGDSPARVVREFWSPFLDTKKPPLVLYSNIDLAGSGDTGLHFFDPAIDSQADRNDTYTGVGEVMAVAQVVRLFGQLGKEVRVQRSRLIAWQEAKDSNLIFLGAPIANLPLRELPAPREFAFRMRLLADGRLAQVIDNLRPQSGEPQSFVVSPNRPYTEDHALICMIEGVKPEFRILILAGTTTLGTQAAMEFVTSPSDLDQLMRRMGGKAGSRLTSFEAVLHTKISGGVPIQSRIVAFRRRQ